VWIVVGAACFGLERTIISMRHPPNRVSAMAMTIGMGMAMAAKLGGDRPGVLQYVAARDFESRLHAPLLAAAVSPAASVTGHWSVSLRSSAPA
jgi:hypothetical protein